MTTWQTIRTAAEFLAIVAVIIGLLNEEKIAAWEKKLFTRIKQIF